MDSLEYAMAGACVVGTVVVAVLVARRRVGGSAARGCLAWYGAFVLLNAVVLMGAAMVFLATREVPPEPAEQARLNEHLLRVERPIVKSALSQLAACRALRLGQEKLRIPGELLNNEYSPGYWTSGRLRLQGAPLVWRLDTDQPVDYGWRLEAVPGVGKVTPLARSDVDPASGPVTVFIITSLERKPLGSSKWGMKGGLHTWVEHGYEDQMEVCVVYWPAKKAAARLLITAGPTSSKQSDDVKLKPHPLSQLADIITALAKENAAPGKQPS